MEIHIRAITRNYDLRTLEIMLALLVVICDAKIIKFAQFVCLF